MLIIITANCRTKISCSCNETDNEEGIRMVDLRSIEYTSPDRMVVQLDHLLGNLWTQSVIGLSLIIFGILNFIILVSEPPSTNPDLIFGLFSGSFFFLLGILAMSYKKQMIIDRNDGTLTYWWGFRLPHSFKGFMRLSSLRHLSEFTSVVIMDSHLPDAKFSGPSIGISFSDGRLWGR